MDLRIVWFCLIGILFTGYAILDGFDFGVGILSLFTRDEKERRIMMNAIGPVWDGNEVWLLTGGGALFAAFPVVYAAVFSGFYLAFMLLLVALIFRAVSFEFRSKVESPAWRRAWDMAFGLGSILPALLFGVAVGNILRGIPIDASGTDIGTFLEMLNPFSLGAGVLSVLLCVLHGAIYLSNKLEGDLQARCRKLASGGWMLFVVLYAAMTVWSRFGSPFLFEESVRNPLFFLFLIVLIGTIAALPAVIKSGNMKHAFLVSSLLIAAILGEAGLGLFPRLVPSSIDLSYSLTIANSSSSPMTLGTMFVIALIGVPLVICYSVYVHYVFRGKVEITEESY
jgi:cytochrome d ubiquinol oxidase subunit II